MTSTPTMFTPGDVAHLLRVDAKTVSRWCREGTLAAYTTPGGHRRIPADALLALLRDMGIEDGAARKMLGDVARNP